MSNYAYIALIPLLPLAGFLILGLLGRRYLKASSGVIATCTLVISTLLSLYAGYHYFFIDGKANGIYRQIVTSKYTWLQFSPGLSIDMSIILDPISVMMI